MISPEWLWLVEPAAGEMLRLGATRVGPDQAAGPPPPPEPVVRVRVSEGSGQVAVIPLSGLLMKRPSVWGGTSTAWAAEEVRKAAADPGVSALLLRVDSPGGAVAGLDELASEVKAAGRRKPVWAQAEDMMASAAFWASSQAGRIYANSNTALVGSIGSYLTIYDLSGALEQQGIRAHHFSTGPLKGAGVMGTAVTPDQAAYFQAIVDGVQADFDRAVRSGRGLSAEQLKSVKSGGVFKAPLAQDLGLIDGIQPFSRTIEQLSRAAEPAGTGRRAGTLPTLTLGTLPTIRGVRR